MNNKTIVSAIVAILIIGNFTIESAIGQSNFSDSGMVLPPTNHALGMADLNGDFRDDLILLSAPRDISIYMQTQNEGMVFANKYTLGDAWDWSFMLGDYNNDGFKSLISSGFYNGTLMNTFSDLQNFTNISSEIDEAFLFAQGANSVDINNDGNLDLFICHDDEDSHIYINDGTGVFNKNQMIDFTTNPASDGSGNYGSIWTYINDDDLLDLYIAKCRGGVNSTSDPRRVNQLYLQNEDGDFIRNSDMGLDIGWQSWTADFADVDNDGDLDCFIINHDHHHMLMENIDNQTFVESTDFAALNISAGDIQGIFEDMDNDGLVDILIFGANELILWNQGDLEFTVDNNVFGDRRAFSASTGDANEDGFLDVLASYTQGLFPNLGDDSKLWLNDGNDNNHLAISLYGKESNREGIGTKILCYSALGKQTRVISSGEGYGIVNSLTARFGLGSDDLIDSLHVIWPSGFVQKFEDVAVNTHYVITEAGSCMENLYADFENESFSICLGQEPISLELVGAEEGLWNGSTVASEIAIVESGFYFAMVQDADSCCVTVTPTIYSEVVDDEAAPILDEPLSEICQGESLVLAGSAELIEWSNGENSIDLVVTEGGMYSYSIQGFCDTLYSNEISVELLDPLSLPDFVAEIPFGEIPRVELDQGLAYEWSFDADMETIISTDNFIELPDLENDTTVFVRHYLSGETISGTAGIDLANTTDGPSPSAANIGTFFDVYRDCILKSVQLRTDIAGERVFQILNNSGAIVFESTIFIPEGVSVVDLNANITIGDDYLLTTDDNHNLNTFGILSPGFTRTSTVAMFPYVLEGVLSITDTEAAGNSYYYFYNWEIESQAKICYSNTAQVEINLLPSSVEEEILNSKWSIRPNPATEELFLTSQLKDSFNLSIRTTTGELVYRSNTSTHQLSLDITDFASGIYVVELISQGQKSVKRFVKM